MVVGGYFFRFQFLIPDAVAVGPLMALASDARADLVVEEAPRAVPLAPLHLQLVAVEANHVANLSVLKQIFTHSFFFVFVFFEAIELPSGRLEGVVFYTMRSI